MTHNDDDTHTDCVANDSDYYDYGNDNFMTMKLIMMILILISMMKMMMTMMMTMMTMMMTMLMVMMMMIISSDPG